MIKLQVIGHLGRDAVTNTVNGKSVINFSVAHSERYKDAQGNVQERTMWVECAYWTDKLAIAPYLTKGKSVFVEGSPHVESYTTKDGKQGVALRLRVQEVQFTGGNKENNTSSTENNAVSNQNNNTNTVATPIAASIETVVDDSDLPF